MFKKIIKKYRLLHPLQPTNINFKKINKPDSIIFKLKINKKNHQIKKPLPTIIDLKGHVDRH